MSNLNEKSCAVCGNVVGRWPTCQTCGFVNRMFTREKGPEVDAYLREVAEAKKRWDERLAEKAELESLRAKLHSSEKEDRIAKLEEKIEMLLRQQPPNPSAKSEIRPTSEKVEISVDDEDPKKTLTVQMPVARELKTRQKSADSFLLGHPSRREAISTYWLARAVAGVMGRDREDPLALEMIFRVYDGFRAEIGTRKNYQASGRFVIPHFGTFRLRNLKPSRKKAWFGFRISPNAHPATFARQDVTWIRRAPPGSRADLSIRRRLFLRIAKSTGVETEWVQLILQETFRLMLLLWKQNVPVVFYKLGTFVPQGRYTCRNPATGEKMTVRPRKYACRLRPSPFLKSDLRIS